MTIPEVIDEIDGLCHLLEQQSTATAHVGICLQAMAVIKDFEVSNNTSKAEPNLYNHPFYNFFSQASNDIHTQYPLRKMAVLDALAGYKRYLSNTSKGNRASTQ